MNTKQVVLFAAGLVVSWSGSAQASCLSRTNADHSVASIHVSESEDAYYLRLGYEVVPCPANEKLQARIDGACRLAAVLPPELVEGFEQRYAVRPERFCESAKLLASERGLVVDASDHGPDWMGEARRKATAAANASPTEVR